MSAPQSNKDQEEKTRRNLAEKITADPEDVVGDVVVLELVVVVVK